MVVCYEHLHMLLPVLQFRRVYQSLLSFVTGDLSSFYLDTSKDRLYIQGTSSLSRRACQTVQAAVLRGMLSALGPLVPHMAEDAWLNAPEAFRTAALASDTSSTSSGSTNGNGASSSSSSGSVFCAGWATGEEGWGKGLGEEEMKAWVGFMAVREAMHMALEQARGEKILGSSLEAAVAVHVSEPKLQQWLQQCNSSGNSADDLRYLLIVSEVDVVGDEQAAAQGAAVSKELEVEGVGKVSVGVRRAAGKKCARCWNYSTEVGAVDAEHAELCERCSPVVRAMGFSLAGAGAAAGTRTKTATAAV